MLGPCNALAGKSCCRPLRRSLPAVPGSAAAFALALLAVKGEVTAAYVGGGVGTEEKEKGDVAAAGPFRPS